MAKHLSEHEKEELGCVFASVILNEDKLPITVNKNNHITKKS